MIEMIVRKDTDIVTGPQISKSKNILLRIMERKMTMLKRSNGLNK